MVAIRFLVAFGVLALLHSANGAGSSTTEATTTEKDSVCKPKHCYSPRGYCAESICWCFPGYYGKNCRVDSDTCANCTDGEACTNKGACNPCDPPCEHGTCMSVAGSGQPQCRCDDGYDGPSCTVGSTTEATTTEEDPVCEPKHCYSPRGYCVDSICWCYPGYYGTNCGEKNDTCANCENGEACTMKGACIPCDPPCYYGKCMALDGSGHPQCRCDDGYHRPSCMDEDAESLAVTHVSSVVSIVMAACVGYLTV